MAWSVTEKMNEIRPGWYHIDEDWDLWIDGELKQRRILTLYVEKNDDDTYHVDHYGFDGYIKTETLDYGDVNDVLGDKEPERNKPVNIL